MVLQNYTKGLEHNWFGVNTTINDLIMMMPMGNNDSHMTNAYDDDDD